MRNLKIKAGPLLAFCLFIASTGYVVTAFVALIEPEVQMNTSLPLARI